MVDAGGLLASPRCCSQVILPAASGDYNYLICIFIAESTENMVHPGGFEPPTARFVAEYSIQLSYGCIGNDVYYKI